MMAAFDQNGPTAVGGKQLERCFISVSLGDRLQRLSGRCASSKRKDKDDLLWRPRLDWIVVMAARAVPQRRDGLVLSIGALEATEAMYSI